MVKLCLIMVMVSGSLLWTGELFRHSHGQAQAASSIKVDVSVLNVRSGPGLHFDIVAKVNKGETYTVLKQEENWYKIQLNDSSTGWVAGWLVTAHAGNGSTTIVSTVDGLNVRSGPSKSFSIIDQIQKGEAYPFVEEQGNWIKIQLSENKTGWVAAWLVEKKAATPGETGLTPQNIATVTVPVLNVRSGPGTHYREIGELKSGQTIEVLDIQNGWYQIRFNSQTGWVAGEYADLRSPEDSGDGDASSASSSSRTVYVTADRLNLRSGPSIESPVQGQVTKGAALTVIEQKGDWLNVRTANGKTAWVASWLVTEQHDVISQTPTVTILYPGTNIRSGPSTEHQVVARAGKGDQFPIVAREGKWFKIRLNNGDTAYVAGWIVAAEGVPDVDRGDSDQFLKGKTIVVDPGHGGIDDGATGPFFNTLEKKLNMQVSQILAAKLKEAGANVVMTRTDDRKIQLQTRVDIAVRHQADMFISIHHNSHPDPRINGTITYFYTNGEDRTLARLIQKELVKRNGRNDLKARRGNYFVLRENPQLAVLVELGFLTNYEEELIMNTREFQENSAEGIFQGIRRYYQR
ncbi:MAG: SH3 domain-containing protein [Bacillaceae bacterium]|nr:SH3 domain-containing protein [Bacillaceae bacterium]